MHIFSFLKGSFIIKLIIRRLYIEFVLEIHKILIMKNHFLRQMIFVLILTSTMVACTKEDHSNGLAPSQARNNSLYIFNTKNSSLNANALRDDLNSLLIRPLTSDERQILNATVEAEKLAKDVMVQLYNNDKSKTIFSDMADSKYTHEEVINILHKVGRTINPVENKPVGAFNSFSMQNKYQDLVNAGIVNYRSALTTGAKVAEEQIVIMENALQQQTITEFKFVYENLLIANRNHLRTFVNELKVLRVDYTPQYLSQNKYQDIIRQSMEDGPVLKR